MRTLYHHCSIATCDAAGRVFERGALLVEGSHIAWVCDAADLPAGLRPERSVDLDGRWLTPGLVDCHTHLVFAGQRAAEFARRTAGTSYAAIAREGGGILATVRATRAASLDELVLASEPRLRSLLAEGVTTVEIKSGYGLELEAERRMLRAARALEARHPVSVVTSLLAAHALPPEYEGHADAYVDEICTRWLPLLAQEHAVDADASAARDRGSSRRATQQPLVDAVDAYCESIGFSAAQCDRLFTAAKRHGWPVRLHSDQISNIGGARVAARHSALACDHLEYATDADAQALAAAGTVAVLLPVAWYVLGDPRLPPIDAFRARGVPLAVASDANPGSAPGASLLTAMHIARRSFGLTSDEVLRGVTRHAARALGRAQRCG
ncbi:MAG: imidazolonepropionase, partial [Steroidobacteraceae bacterium]